MQKLLDAGCLTRYVKCRNVATPCILHNIHNISKVSGKVEGKVNPVTCQESAGGNHSLTSVLCRGWVVNGTPRPLYPLNRDPVLILHESLVGFGDGQDGCGKTSAPPEFDPWTFQPVPSHYTD